MRNAQHSTKTVYIYSVECALTVDMASGEKHVCLTFCLLRYSLLHADDHKALIIVFNSQGCNEDHSLKICPEILTH